MVEVAAVNARRHVRATETLRWALCISALSAGNCFLRLAQGANSESPTSETWQHALNVIHSPLAVIGGAALLMAVVERFYPRPVDAISGQPGAWFAGRDDLAFTGLAVFALALLNCSRLQSLIAALHS